MSPRIGVITFPGSLDDVDAARAVTAIGAEYVALWHADHDLRNVDAVIVPGGFSYGDYLRAGAIASHAPIMRAVIDGARAGLPVLGICNGFQVLCEAGLLPGALLRNAGLRFVCRDQVLRSGGSDSLWTQRYPAGDRIVVPVKHADGRYVAHERTLDELHAERRVIFTYDGNPNGSLRDIAGVCSADGRVAGLMPHPEHAIDPLTGPSADGLGFFLSLADFLGFEPPTNVTRSGEKILTAMSSGR
jgi:phosphoribosylformylglycinamidine synthase